MTHLKKNKKKYVVTMEKLLVIQGIKFSRFECNELVEN